MAIVSLVLILIVLVVPLALVALLRKRARGGLTDYIVAGRGQGSLLVAASLLATILGASAVMGTAGLGAKHGWSALVWLWAGAVGLAVFALLVKRLRVEQALTLPQLVQQNGGPAARIATGLVIVPTWLGIIAAQLIAVQTIAEALLPGWGMALMVLALVSLTTYVGLGGQGQVLRTDRWQLVLLLVALLALGFGFLGNHAVGMSPVMVTPLELPRLVDIALAVGVPFLIGPDIVSRLLTLPDAPARRKSLLVAACALLLVAVLVVGVGLAAGRLTGSAGDGLLLDAAGHLWGQGGKLLVGVALLAALLSSADTCLMTAASIVSLDILGMRRSVAVAWATAGLAALSLMLALWLKGIIPALFFSYTVYTGGLGLPVFIALFTRIRLHAPAWIASAFIGGGLGIAARVEHWPYGLPLALGASALVIGASELFSRFLARQRF